MEKKKISLIMIIIVVLVLSIIGVTYALWTITIEQTEANIIQLDCFNIEFEENIGSFIKLTNAFPLRDSEGEKLTPYHFKVINTCNSYASYQVRIEVKKNSTLDDKYLKVMLNKKYPKTLTRENYEESDVLLGKETTKAYILETGYLDTYETKEYDLRLWLDENVTLESKNSNEELVQNSSWEGLITVSSSYSPKRNAILANKEIEVVKENDGLYEIKHENVKGTTDDNGFSQTEYRYSGSNPNNYVDVKEKYETDIYGFFKLRKLEYYTEEKCNINRNQQYLSNGDKITSCVSTLNTDQLYFLEYKQPLVEMPTIKTFDSLEACQNVENRYDSSSILQTCICPEEVYSFTVTYRENFYNYEREEECISQNNGNEGFCKLTHHSDEPSYWRIIGLVNVKSNNQIEQRLKIVRDEPLNVMKAWDNSSNDWTQSSLMLELNDQYYQNLQEVTKNMIDENITWNIGGWEAEDIPDEEQRQATEYQYAYERGTKTATAPENDKPFPVEWKGKVGLMYASDLSYAQNMYASDFDYTINWLSPPLYKNEWLLSPYISSWKFAHAEFTGRCINQNCFNVTNTYAIRPVVYLKPNVVIINQKMNDGSKNHPYELALSE